MVCHARRYAREPNKDDILQYSAATLVLKAAAGSLGLVVIKRWPHVCPKDMCPQRHSQDRSQLINEVSELTGDGGDPLHSPCIAKLLVYAQDDQYVYSIQQYGGMNLAAAINTLVKKGYSQEIVVKAITAFAADILFGLSAFHKRVSDAACLPISRRCSPGGTGGSADKIKAPTCCPAGCERSMASTSQLRPAPAFATHSAVMTSAQTAGSMSAAWQQKSQQLWSLHWPPWHQF